MGEENLHFVLQLRHKWKSFVFIRPFILYLRLLFHSRQFRVVIKNGALSPNKLDAINTEPQMKKTSQITMQEGLDRTLISSNHTEINLLTMEVVG